MKNFKPDYKGFGEHLLEYEEKSIPIGMSDLIRLAKKYHTPIPIGFDKNNNPIFKEEELSSQQYGKTRFLKYKS